MSDPVASVTCESRGGQLLYRFDDLCLGIFDGPIYIWRGETTGLYASHDPHATVDLRRWIDPTEWDEEYGGAVTYNQLRTMVEKSYRNRSSRSVIG